MKRTISDEFTLETMEKVVAIMFKGKGFDGIQPQALDATANLLNTYLDKLFTTAHLSAELGNRARPNIHDITRSFELSGIDMSSFKEYLQTLHTNEDRQALKYFESIKEESTLETTPDFLPSDHEDSDEDMDDNHLENGMPTYVPKHLPAFPSKHSFRQTPIYISRPDDPQKVRELNSEQSRTVEENLKKLMASENELLRQTNQVVSTSSSMMMPIVNYEVFMQRRKRQKQSGATLNVEGSDDKPNTNNVDSENNTTTENQSELSSEAIVADN